jgi:hypothetical protein
VLTVLAWFAALRFAPNFFWISPLIPWTACAATVGVTIWIKGRFERSMAPLPAVALEAA